MDNIKLKRLGILAGGTVLAYILLRNKSSEDTSTDTNTYSIQKQEFIEYIKTIPVPTEAGDVFPMFIDASTNTWFTTDWSSWTSGFYPASLCWIYKQTLLSTDLDNAINTINFLYENDTADIDSHDQNQYFAYIKGMELVNTSSLNYTNWKNKALQHADRLVNYQYDSTVGAITFAISSFSILVDSMALAMPLLIWAYKNTDNITQKEKYLNVMNSHANVVIRDHLSGKTETGSVWNIVGYKTDGTVSWHSNGQTENIDDSGNANVTWARGQAWIMYGLAELYEFNLTYNLNNTNKYLDAFKLAADFWIEKLNSSWSDNGVMKNTIGALYPKYDTSATATATSALFKMSTLTSDSILKEKYLNAAKKSLERLLSSNYLANGKLIHGFYAPMILNSTDTEVIWGDYFLTEVFSRMY